MNLREFLDKVRFGNTARLCVAIKGDNDFLDNYEEGKYWELPAGNWDKGSESRAKSVNFPHLFRGACVCYRIYIFSDTNAWKIAPDF